MAEAQSEDGVGGIPAFAAMQYGLPLVAFRNRVARSTSVVASLDGGKEATKGE